LGRESYKRSYHWNAANQLVQTVNHLDRKGIIYSYDELNQLVSATGGIEAEYKCPDAVGNLYETPERTDRKYESGGKLTKDKNWHYYYDTLGNLVLKSPFPLHGKEPSKKWQQGRWHYEWYANGMLKSVQKPGGAIVSFEYDALGRRTAKIAGKKITRYLWDGNVLLQEWSYDVTERPILQVGELGELFYNRAEPITNLISWIYEQGSFTPIAKLVDGERFSIVSDYLGTPIQAFDSNGELIWERELNIFGGVRQEKGIANFVAMRYQGQYFDEETGLSYNRFRYYDSNSGIYLSQDPIGITGGIKLYSYALDTNSRLDVFGLFHHDDPGHNVYGLYDIVGYDANGSPVLSDKPYYIGISNNTDLRSQQHMDSGRIIKGQNQMVVLDENISYGQARGYEQAYIDHYGTKTGTVGEDISKTNRGNKINSFDVNNTTRAADRQKSFMDHRKSKLDKLKSSICR
jgi:RHS repeat-associated protein